LSAGLLISCFLAKIEPHLKEILKAPYEGQIEVIRRMQTSLIAALVLADAYISSNAKDTMPWY
jgi:hypothetical protein